MVSPSLPRIRAALVILLGLTPSAALRVNSEQAQAFRPRSRRVDFLSIAVLLPRCQRNQCAKTAGITNVQTTVLK